MNAGLSGGGTRPPHLTSACADSDRMPDLRRNVASSDHAAIKTAGLWVIFR
jgi:hypothetical protein